MSKKFNCMSKFQDRECRKKLAKNFFNAHLKLNGFDNKPMTLDEMAIFSSVAIASCYFVKKIVKLSKEDIKNDTPKSL